MAFLSKLRGRSGTDRILRKRRMLHLPHDLTSPGILVVLSGGRREDIWAALFLMHSLQKNFPDARHVLVCRERDSELAGMLRWLPETLHYTDTPRDAAAEVSGIADSSAILFHPYDGMSPDDAAFIAGSGVPVCISTIENSAVNLCVRVDDRARPELIYRMCEILGIEPDRTWRPVIPASWISGAASILAPVTGRALPYIAATTAAAGLLEKHRAEVPIRMVVVEGKRSEIPDVSRGVMAAIVGGASAVATTDPWLWLKARALEVPAVGLDRNARFPGWSGEKATDEDDFLQLWADLLRRGW
jgi:hypothetical protein